MLVLSKEEPFTLFHEIISSSINNKPIIKDSQEHVHKYKETFICMLSELTRHVVFMGYTILLMNVIHEH